MNRAQRGRFDQFLDARYSAFVVEIAQTHPDESTDRACAAFADAYRFWGKLEDSGDPVGWIRHNIAEQRPRRNIRRRRWPFHGGDVVSDPTELDRRRIVFMARRQRAIGTIVITTTALLLVAGELLVAHR